MTVKICNIPIGCAFLDCLAARFLKMYQDKPLDLADVLFLLPNRRACQSLTEAFVRQQGLKPTLLPQMQPLSDVEEDELLIKGFDWSPELKTLTPAISPVERQMLFTKLLMSKPADYGIEKMPAGQATALAKELSSLMDMFYQQQLSFDNLQNIVPEEYAVHWQETLKFLRILTQYWPSILQDAGKTDAVQRQNLLFQMQINLWSALKPRKKIVIAGTTAPFPLMKELVKVVSTLENGEVILYGLDKYLPDNDWQKLDEMHPQYELKALLDYLQIDRLQVEDIEYSQNQERGQFISEVMRPAQTSDQWRHLSEHSFSKSALQNLYLLNCPDARTEALSISLLMREVLETPEKTAALVTTDRTLARRVASELSRWGIEVDDSAGIPLTLTPVGIFLRQILDVIAQNFSAVSILSLMKYPLYTHHCNAFEMRKVVRQYEKQYLRTKEKTLTSDVESALRKALSPLVSLYETPSVKLSDLLKKHIAVAEELASTDLKSGDKILWKGEDGEAAARFMADMLDKADVLGNIAPEEYADWLSVLMGGVTVRRRYGAHPRLKILGPIEARLIKFDRVIIGEVNENSWPQTIKADPWLSRPMKKDFGLPLPEKNIGVQAGDFSSLLAYDEVFLTRANRVQGTPMVKSRWLMRLETVLQAVHIKPEQLEASQYLNWAIYLDKAQILQRILPPAPKPPVSARPRELPATAIENLMRDPYIIFAKYILKLKPLDDLDQDQTFADYGNIVHAVLEEFNNKYNKAYPVNAREELIRLGDYYFKEHHISAEQKAFWWPNFLKTVDWLVEKETFYRQDVLQIYNEVKGQYNFNAPAGKFTVTAKADRIDVTKDHKLNIIDYKTGQARKPKEIEQSYAPQLPIEAIIAEKGGFTDVPAEKVESLRYWQLGRKETGIFANADKVLQNTYERIVELISLFDFEETPYLSKPNPKCAPKYSDYTQLSRLDEITFGEEE